MNIEKFSRRDAVLLGLAGLAGTRLRNLASAAENPPPAPVSTRPFLTPALKFNDVSRGNPKPHTLRGDALIAARLTPETWRLEVVGEASAQVGKSLTIQDGTALDFATLQAMGRTHGVKFLKAMQCLNIPIPLGQGFWEGVPLRDILRLLGPLGNTRRIFYSGFHNDDPKQLFQSSLSYTQVMETPPGELPVFVAYRLNGEPLPLERGGPVRMVVPWAHGFKSIKWLQKISLTNDYKANDTYAEAGNDPESHLKTAAYLDDIPKELPGGKPVTVTGLAMCGWSGFKSIEYWLRPAPEIPVPEKPADIASDDPAWKDAKWVRCHIAEPPADWSSVFPSGVSPRDVLGFDPESGKPKAWPLRYSMVAWHAVLPEMPPGHYEVRARSIDMNGFAQPEPRPSLKTGRNPIQVRRFQIT